MDEVFYYSADWCQPCRTFGPLFDRVVQDYRIVVKKIDIDHVNDVNGLRKAMDHNVMQIPMLVIERNGKAHSRHVGTMDEQSLREFLTI